MLVYSLWLRRDISRAIRRYRPDAVLVSSWDVEFVAASTKPTTGWPVWLPSTRCGTPGTGGSSQSCLKEDLEPWSPRWLLVSGDPRPTHGVDVSGDPLERGIASLEAHREYLSGIPGHPPPRLMITGITAMQGRRMSVAHAVLFRAFDFHAPPPIALEAMQLAEGNASATDS